MTPTTHTLLRAEGFSCPSCVRKIEKALDVLPGVTGAQVHFETQLANTQYCHQKDG